MKPENTLNQEKWRTIEDHPRFLQRTFIKRVWPTRIIFRASLRYKLAPERRVLCVQSVRSSSSQRIILFVKYARRSANLKYPLNCNERFTKKYFLSLGVVGFVVVCSKVERACCIICQNTAFVKPGLNFFWSMCIMFVTRFCEFLYIYNFIFLTYL